VVWQATASSKFVRQAVATSDMMVYHAARTSISGGTRSYEVLRPGQSRCALRQIAGLTRWRPAQSALITRNSIIPTQIREKNSKQVEIEVSEKVVIRFEFKGDFNQSHIQNWLQGLFTTTVSFVRFSVTNYANICPTCDNAAVTKDK
jgi:hypothetical protein